MIYECVLIAMLAAILWYTVHTGSAFTYVMGEFPAPWGNEIRAGILEALFAMLFMIVMLCSIVSGAAFVIRDLDESKVNLYYTLINFMTASIMALLFTNDLFTGYVFVEILTLTSCGILIVREMGRTTLAAVRYMIMNLLGSGMFLLGITLFYELTGHLLMVPMRDTIALLAISPDRVQMLTLSLGIMTIGLCIKSGLFPFHFWMPDTYGFATPTSASIMSSLVSKTYIFLLIKIYYRIMGLGLFEQLPIRDILFILGICGMVFGSVSAMRAPGVNRMVAFSSAAQIGYIFMGIGIGGTLGYAAALFQVLAHCVTKSLLFLTAPRLSRVSGDSLIFKELQGAGLRDRHAGFFFLFCSLSMIGIPGFAGFSAKLYFSIAAIENGTHFHNLVMIMVMLALTASSLLNALYFIRTDIRIYTHKDKNDYPAPAQKRFRPAYDISSLVLVAVNLSLGLFSPVFLSLIENGLQMFG